MLLAIAHVSPSCPGTTTPQVEACLQKALETDEQTLAAYLGAARSRIRRNAGSDVAAIAEAFDASQTAWRTFRDTECNAVYQYWREGTIRGARLIQCRARLTKQRTWSIWAEWLTYPDSTPPDLPEPEHAAARP